MDRKRLIIYFALGSIFLLIGGIITTYGLSSVATAKKVNDVEKDIDLSTNTFKSYDKGDKFFLTGRIITIIETKYIFKDDEEVTDEFLIENFGGKYIYILDKKVEVYSNEKIGNIGDTVYIECEIDELTKSGRLEEILKVNPSINLIMITTLGIVFLIISFINIFLVIKKKKRIEKAHSQPFKIARLYEDIEEEDEETFLYKFLKTKDNNPMPTHNQLPLSEPGGQGALQNAPNIAFTQPDMGYYPTETKSFSQPTSNYSQLPQSQTRTGDRSGISAVTSFETSNINKIMKIPGIREHQKVSDTRYRKEIPVATSVQINQNARSAPQAVPVQSCFSKIKQKQIRPLIATQPTIATRPSLAQNIQSVPTNMESSTQKLKTSADKLKMLTEKMQVPIAKPTARALTPIPTKPAFDKLIKVKVPTAKIVQPTPNNVPPIKKPIMAKPVSNQEIKNPNKIMDRYKDIESEDDELALYKSLHSINDTDN